MYKFRHSAVSSDLCKTITLVLQSPPKLLKFWNYKKVFYFLGFFFAMLLFYISPKKSQKGENGVM